MRQTSVSPSVVNSSTVDRSTLEAILVVIAIAAICLTCTVIGWLYWDELNADESVSATLRNFFLIAGAPIAIILALWRSKIAHRQAAAAHHQVETGLQQTAIAQDGLLYDRFQRAAQMLGHNEISVRIGGVQALSELAVQHMDRYYVTVANLLDAFTSCPPNGGTSSGPDWSGDVQVATDALNMLHELSEGRIDATEVFDLVPDDPSSLRRP